MFKKLAVIFFISLSGAAMAAADPNVPSGHFSIDPPKNWVADNESGASQGVAMVFYPKGGSWKDSPAVLYIRVADKISNSVQRLIDEDVKNYQEISPDVEVTDQSGIFTKDGRLAVVKKIQDKASGNMEEIAYIGEEQTITIITLNARSDKEAKKGIAAFKELVGSYKFMKADVAVDENTDAEDKNTKEK